MVWISVPDNSYNFLFGRNKIKLVFHFFFVRDETSTSPTPPFTEYSNYIWASHIGLQIYMVGVVKCQGHLFQFLWPQTSRKQRKDATNVKSSFC